MKKRIMCMGIIIVTVLNLFGQDSVNCFLMDFQPKYVTIPEYTEYVQPTASPSVIVSIDHTDTITKVSKYIFGNTIAAWSGNIGDDPGLLENINFLAPALIRYPGGSWSDIFFWNACDAGDIVGLPTTLIDGTNGSTYSFSGEYGKDCPGNWRMNFNNYNYMRNQTGSQGLITINYGYARYGLANDPVAQAAHLAADWVRSDNGRTRFWEIGNESGGPWEAGWQIDTANNKDGQPEIITGRLYGEHFKVFADSMRKAASESGDTIYIGAQILHYDGTDSWNYVDRTWNEGVFEEIGDSADFYVVHNYFGDNSTNAQSYLNAAKTLPEEMMDFMLADIAGKNAALKPIALTEWNINSPGEVKTSIINGLQASIITSELIKLQYGMSCRWLIANWESDGMFYAGNNSSIPDWFPRPAFFFLYYLQKFFGDHLIQSSSSNDNILTYASKFKSGEIGLIIINTSLFDETIAVSIPEFGIGDRYYFYSLTGGSDNGELSQQVYVNAAGPDLSIGGPLENLENIKAFSSLTEGSLKIYSPGRSVQYVLIENGNNSISSLPENIKNNDLRIYPNPAKEMVTLEVPENSTAFEIVNIQGQVVYRQDIDALYNEIKLHPDFSSGIYFIKVYQNNNNTATEKLIVN